jgi:hypothetical protein
MNRIDYTQYKNKTDCQTNELTNKKSGDDCGVWDGMQCRKGKVNDQLQCIAPGTVLPLLLTGLSLILFIASIVYLVIGLRS